MVKKNNATRSGGESRHKNSLLGNNSRVSGEGASPSAVPAIGGVDAALVTAILADAPAADYIPEPMPMEPDRVENVRKLEAAGAALWCGYELTAPKPDGKRGKIPKSRSGSARIGTDKPGDFYNLDDAIALNQAGKVHGVGILVSGAPGIVGIDLDKCIGPDGELAGWAAAIVERFATYTEVSVSGTGLHLFMLATKPPGYGEKPGGIEVYDASSKRFLTVSGNLWSSGWCDIEDRQAVLEDWLAEVSSGTGGGNRARFGSGTAGRVGLAGANAANDGAEGQGSNGNGPAPAPAADVGAGNRCVLRENDEVARLVLAVNNSGGLLQRMIRGSLTDAEQQQFRKADGTIDESRVDQAIMYRIAWITYDAQQCAEVFEEIAPDRTTALGVRKGKNRVAELLLQSAKNAVDERKRKAEPTYDELQAAKVHKAEQQEQRQANFAELLAGGLGGVTVNRKGAAYATMANLLEILQRAYALAGKLVFDDFAGEVRKLGQLPAEIMPPVRLWGSLSDAQFLPLADDDAEGVRFWLSRKFGAEFRKADVDSALMQVARGTQINSVADVLEKLEWDGKRRLRTWLRVYLNADVTQDRAEYVDLVGWLFLIQAVARAYVPGCKADCSLIFEGDQGSRKSEAIKIIGRAIAPHTFRENIPDQTSSDSKAMQQMIQGGWFVEMQEMKNVRGTASVEHIKALLTTQEDGYRVPFDKRPKIFVRTAVFVGSVNPDGAGYLADATGGRRFWPVAVGHADTEALRVDMAQLFAEAVHEYKNGAQWWIDARTPEAEWASEAVRRRMPGDAWEDLLVDRLTGKGGESLRLADIWQDVLRLGNYAECTPSKQAQLVKVLKRMGFVHKKTAECNRWVVPSRFK